MIPITEQEMIREFFLAEKYKFEDKMWRDMDLSHYEDEMMAFMINHRGYPNKYIFTWYEDVKSSVQWYQTTLSLDILKDRWFHCSWFTKELSFSRKLSENVEKLIKVWSFNTHRKLQFIINQISNWNSLAKPIIILHKSTGNYIVLEWNHRVICYLYSIKEAYINVLVGEIEYTTWWKYIEWV